MFRFLYILGFQIVCFKCPHEVKCRKAHWPHKIIIWVVFICCFWFCKTFLKGTNVYHSKNKHILELIKDWSPYSFFCSIIIPLQYTESFSSFVTFCRQHVLCQLMHSGLSRFIINTIVTQYFCNRLIHK